MEQEKKRKSYGELGALFTKDDLASNGYRYVKLFGHNMGRYQEVEYAGIKCLRDLSPHFRDNSDDFPNQSGLVKRRIKDESI